MKKQFLSKVIFSIALLGNLSIMTSQADYDWLMTDPQGKQWLLDQPYLVKKSLFYITRANRDSLSTGARTIGPDLELPSLSTGGGAGGGAGSGTGGGGASSSVAGGGAAKLSADQANVDKMHDCIQIMSNLLSDDPDLAPGFILPIGTPRKSYNLGTLGKQPADHGKKGKRAAMTSAEKKRHKDLADRKNGRHNKVMQDKKAPHKKAAARGGKKAGNVKAQAIKPARNN